MLGHDLKSLPSSNNTAWGASPCAGCCNLTEALGVCLCKTAKQHRTCQLELAAALTV